MENKKMYGFVALAMVALLGVSFAAAYQGDSSVQGPNYSEDRHDAMTAAFETGDYDAWVALMSESGRQPRVLEMVNAENFDVFAEAHEADMAGDSELANELRAELGLGNGQGSGQNKAMKQGMGRGSGMGSYGQNGDCPYVN